jgi:HSP20 family protein
MKMATSMFRFPGGWDPFGTLRLMQRELERLSGQGALGAFQRIGGGIYPAINVLSSPDEIVVQAEVPGVAREELDLTITGETLMIKGAKKPQAGEDELRYQKRERGVGDFSRTVVLPDKVDAERVEANLADGLLTVRLPKSDAAKPRQISVK